MKTFLKATFGLLITLLTAYSGQSQEDPFLVSGGTSVMWHPSEMIFAISNDNTITIVNGETLQPINVLTNLEGNVVSLSWSNNGDKVVFGLGRRVLLWNNPFESDQIVELPRFYPEGTNLNLVRPVNSLAWSSDDTLIAGASGQSVKVWNVVTGDEIASLNRGWSFINQVQWNSLNQFTIANQDSSLYLVNFTTQETEKRFFALGDAITPFYALDRNASGNQLAASWDEGTLIVWDVQNAPAGTSIEGVRLVGSSRAHDDPIISVDWSPNDLYIATGSVDGTAKIWDAQTGELIQTINVAPPGTSVSVSWSYDSTRLAYIVDGQTMPTIITPDLPTMATPTPLPPSPIPTSSPTPTPTPTPTLLSPLRLTSMCSPDPASVRVWRVRNPNAVQALITWQVVGTQQTSSLIVPASSDAFFETVTVPGPNTTRIFLNGVQQDVKASGTSQCG